MKDLDIVWVKAQARKAYEEPETFDIMILDKNDQPIYRTVVEANQVQIKEG